jgi:hypothetical protein
MRLFNSSLSKSRNHDKSLSAPFLVAVCLLLPVSSAFGNDIDALIGELGLGCKNRVLEQFDVPNSDINVRLGATLQQSIDAGKMTAEDLKQYGASFDWSVTGKNASGYCNVGGNGEVSEFKQW